MKSKFLIVLCFFVPSLAHAQHGYFTFQVGGFFPSNSIEQQIYGTEYHGDIGFGLEADDGLAGEFVFFLSANDGTPITQGLAPGESVASTLAKMQIALRVLKNFGERATGESASHFALRPYVGAQASYCFGNEQFSDTTIGSYGIPTTSKAVAYFSGYGFGAFGGLQFGQQSGVTLSVEGSYDLSWWTLDSFSNQTGYQAVTKQSANLNGFGLTANMRVYF